MRSRNHNPLSQQKGNRRGKTRRKCYVSNHRVRFFCHWNPINRTHKNVHKSFRKTTTITEWIVIAHINPNKLFMNLIHTECISWKREFAVAKRMLSVFKRCGIAKHRFQHVIYDICISIAFLCIPFARAQSLNQYLHNVFFYLLQE